MTTQRRNIAAACAALGALALFAQPGRAEDQPIFFGGTIVSIRGNIVQYHPDLGARLARVIVGPDTVIAIRNKVKLDDLKPGMRIMTWGLGDPEKGDFRPSWTMVNKEAVGEFAEKFHGFKPNDYANFGKAGGTLTSVKPFEITDDDGHKFTANPTSDGFFWEHGRGTRKDLLVGMKIDGDAVKMPDGVAKATSISYKARPGKAGAVFGTILAVNGEGIDIRPRFTEDTLHITFAPKANLQRQVALDPDSVRLGDHVSVWGKAPVEERGPHTDLIAYAVLLGKKSYPRATDNSTEVEDQTRTGVVMALHPFTLKQDDGKSVTVAIPGQMPYSDLRPIKIKDLKPGAQVMVIGDFENEGSLKAAVLVLDAPPIVGLGD
jgi:hypothetical protein